MGGKGGTFMVGPGRNLALLPGLWNRSRREWEIFGWSRIPSNLQ